MKTFKNIIQSISAASILMIGTTNVQAQMTYVQGGLNLANISSGTNGSTQKNNFLPTFNAGIMTRFGLSKVVDLETGLLFTGKGAKAETFFTNDDFVKSKFNPLYIELPLNIVVSIPFGDHTGLFVNAGPYAAVGVAGKSKTETRLVGVNSSTSSNIKFSNDNPFTSEQDDAGYNKIKRFDFGANVGAGIQLSAILFKVNYGFGFAKINSTQGNNNADNKNKYRTWSFSVGIPISKKIKQ